MKREGDTIILTRRDTRPQTNIGIFDWLSHPKRSWELSRQRELKPDVSRTLTDGEPNLTLDFRMPKNFAVKVPSIRAKAVVGRVNLVSDHILMADSRQHVPSPEPSNHESRPVNVISAEISEMTTAAKDTKLTEIQAERLLRRAFELGDELGRAGGGVELVLSLRSLRQNLEAKFPSVVERMRSSLFETAGNPPLPKRNQSSGPTSQSQGENRGPGKGIR
jgi:hypothetical protein